MKILLLGDFSSSHYNLQQALKEREHDVTLVSRGDGFKRTPSDVKLYTRKPTENKILGAIKEMYNQYEISKTLRNFDIVQTAAHVFFHNRIDKYLFPKIFDYNKKTVMFHGASTLPYNRFVKTLKYFPCDTCKLYDLPGNKCIHEEPDAESIEYSLYERYNAIVSSHYEYYKSFENTIFKNKNLFIPIIIKHNKQNILPSFDGKLNVYYGEIRKGFKGGAVIEKAIEMVKSSTYSEKFNFFTSKHIPYDEYIKVINETHILIDQVNSYSYGVNSLIGMSKGKIVLSGAEKEAVEFMGSTVEECPIINIEPTAEDVFNKLISLLNDKKNLRERSEGGISFVQKYHSPEKISQQYETFYQSLLNE